MTYFEPGEISTPRVSPHVLLGAASPLWAYFGAATFGGVAYWWMTRWTQAANLEAFFHAAERTTQPMLEAAVEQVEQAVEEPVTPTAAVERTLDAATEATETAIERAAEAYEAATQTMSDAAKTAIETAEEVTRAPSRTRKGPVPPVSPSTH